MRRVKPGNAWHPAKDQLRGTEVYGSPDKYDADATFSVRFDKSPYDEFLFATGDLKHWVWCTSGAVYGEYANQPRPVIGSSANTAPHEIRWYRRPANREDPWISLQDHHEENCRWMVYGEDSFSVKSHTRLTREHNGACVFIRDSQTLQPNRTHLAKGSTGSLSSTSSGRGLRESGSLTDRLLQLKNAHEEGLVDDEELAEARKQVLSSFLA